MWHASCLEGVARRWPVEEVFTAAVRARWDDGCAEAAVFCQRRGGGGRGRLTSEAADFYAGLSPGTLVWGLCERSPHWPGRVASRQEEEDCGLSLEPGMSDGDYCAVRFFGPKGGFLYMSLADIALFLPGQMWRDWFRARSEAERKDRLWPHFNDNDWDDWEMACNAADMAFSKLHASKLFPAAPSAVRSSGTAAGSASASTAPVSAHARGTDVAAPRVEPRQPPRYPGIPVREYRIGGTSNTDWL
jgi:PWWP domain